VRVRTKAGSRPVDRSHNERPKLWDMEFSVCIPSAGRPAVLAKTLHNQPFLNQRNTFIGVSDHEADAYHAALRSVAPNVRIVVYTNPTGSIAVCREHLRRAALDAFPRLTGKRVVVTDDNAQYTSTALDALVGTARTWRESPVIVAGMHGTAAHFDRHRLPEMEVYRNYRSYPQVAMIFQVYPAELYAEYEYPPDAYGLDDRHMALWAIARKGLQRSQFRVAMDAPYRKSRYQTGGQGDVTVRARKTGVAIARLATDFPEIVGTRGTLPIPWQVVFALGEGKHVDRLAGGSMRSESALISTPNRS
jgi:hypothetical protein